MRFRRISGVSLLLPIDPGSVSAHCRRLAAHVPTSNDLTWMKELGEWDEMARRTPDPYEGRSPEQFPQSRLLNPYGTSLPARSSRPAPARTTRETRTSWPQCHSLVCS